MSLKLFRSTGYSSILAPGESRLATHPGWLILATSFWIGFVCNVAVWRALRLPAISTPGLGRALLAGAFVAATCATFLSLLGWRRTLKHATCALLLLASLTASVIWVQQLSLDSNLLDHGFRTVLVPAWPTLLRWQFPALLVTLGLLPMLWVWQLQLRRLPGPAQLASNVKGMLLGMLVMAATGWFVFRPS